MTKHRHPRYAEAISLYSNLRRAAYARALDRCVSLGAATAKTRITSIDENARAAYSATWRGMTHWSGAGGWPWDLMMKRVLQKPRSFHVAVWEGTELCGLALGSVSKGRRQITLRFMESSPHPERPLRGAIAIIVFEAAAALAEVLGADRILLRNPLPVLLPFYARFGFTLASENAGLVYFGKTLTYAR